jgi:NodT family efflux transporter outer membrane factor (OMF) lipoprotein
MQRRFYGGAAQVLLLPIYLGLSGCLLGTPPPEPNVEIPPVYRAAPKGDQEAALPTPEWWRGFRSNELTSFIEEAQAYNLDVAIAVAQITQADAQAGIAGAPLLPSLSGTADAQRQRASQRIRNNGGNNNSLVSSQYQVGLTASYIVDLWGKNRAALNAAEETAIASRYNRDVVALTAIASVANTYFQVLAAQDQLRVTQRNLAAAERILGLIRQQFSGGLVSELEVAQQAALVATQRAAIPPLEVTLKQNIVTLAVLLGRAPMSLTIFGGSTAQITVPPITPGLPAQLLNQRPDIQFAEAQLASSNYSVESARAAFFPQIQLTGSTGFQSLALASLFGPGAWYYTMAASLTQPIFDGFLLQNQLELAEGVQLQYLNAYRKAVLSAFSDVEKALVALESYTRQERLQLAVVTNSRRAFEIAETQLRGGTVNLVTVLQTQQTLFSAENALIEVRLNKLLAASSLFQALGGGWTTDDTIVTTPLKD